MKDFAREQFADMTLESWIDTGMFYFLAISSLAGVILLGLLLFRLYVSLRNHFSSGQPRKRLWAHSFRWAWLVIQIYLVAALTVGYVPLLFSGRDDMRLAFPFDLVVAILARYQTAHWYPFAAIALTVGLIFVSLIFMLNGFARLLASDKGRYRGQGSLVVSFLISLVPIVIYMS